MIKLKFWQFFCPNPVKVCFALLYHKLFWFSQQQSFYDKFSINLNILSDGKVALFTKTEKGSLVSSL